MTRSKSLTHRSLTSSVGSCWKRQKTSPICWRAPRYSASLSGCGCMGGERTAPSLERFGLRPPGKSRLSLGHSCWIGGVWTILAASHRGMRPATNAGSRLCSKSQLRSAQGNIGGLVEPLAARLFEEPLDDGVDVHGLVELVLTLATEGMAEFSVFVRPLRERTFEAVRRGCRADELREAARLLDDPPSDNDLNALRVGCAAYLEHYYSGDRLECRSDNEFEELIDNLTFFRAAVNVETDAFVAELEAARQELHEEEEQYAEAHAEEYKERWREARQEDESIADMFDSLRSDGGG